MSPSTPKSKASSKAEPEAAAAGDISYAGPPETWPTDDRKPELVAGTLEHLEGDRPYEGVAVGPHDG